MGGWAGGSWRLLSPDGLRRGTSFPRRCMTLMTCTGSKRTGSNRTGSNRLCEVDSGTTSWQWAAGLCLRTPGLLCLCALPKRMLAAKDLACTVG